MNWPPTARGGLATFARLETCGWLLIGLDSLLEGHGHGALGADQCAWLEASLAAHPTTPALLFVHHPPLPEVGSSPGFTTQAGLLFDEKDRLALESLLARRPGQVKAICVGHVHAVFDEQIAGVPVLGTPSSWVQHSITAQEPADKVSYEDLPPGFRVIRLRGSTVGDGAIDTEVVRIDATAGAPRL